MSVTLPDPIPTLPGTDLVPYTGRTWIDVPEGTEAPPNAVREDAAAFNGIERGAEATSRVGLAAYAAVLTLDAALRADPPAALAAVQQLLADLSETTAQDLASAVAGLVTSQQATALAQTAAAAAVSEVIGGAPDAANTLRELKELLDTNASGDASTAAALSALVTVVAGKATPQQIADAVAGLAAVARTGSYTDLANRPTIPSTPGAVGAEPAGAVATAVAALPAVARSGAYADLTGRPDLSGLVTKTAADATYAQKPSGGTDGQALVKSGSGTAWATVGGGSLPFTLLTPSGDTTGATDLAAINGALVNGPVTLVGDFIVNAPIEIPSHRTLVLQNAEVRLASFSNCVLVRNKNQNATGDRFINLVGIGRARLRSVIGSAMAAHFDAGVTQLTLVEPIPTGNYVLGDKASIENVTVTACTTTAPYVATLAAPTTAAVEPESGIVNQTRGSGGGDIRNGMGIFFVNVEDYTVSGVSIGPTLAFTAIQQACRRGRWTNIHLAQNRAWKNQDGIDIGAGCRDIIIRGVTGTTSDDLFSIYAQNTSPSLHSYIGTLSNADRDISGIYIADAAVDVGINPVRLQAGDGSKLSKVRLHNIANTGTKGGLWPVIELGPTGYVNTAPALGDISDVVLDGFAGPSKFLLALDSPAQDITIRNAKTVTAPLVGFVAANGGICQAADIVIENVVTSSTGGSGAMMAASTGTVAGITFRNILLRRATAFLANGATVTGLRMENVRAVVLGGVAFQSTTAETGSASDVRVDTYSSGVQHYAGAACQIAFTGEAPDVITGDVQPAPTRGSRLTARAGIDLTGGSATQGALYVADGTAWNRLLALANDGATVTVPGQVTGLTAGTPGPTSQPLSWTSVTGATSYKVEYKLSSASTWTTVTGITGATYTATGLTATTSYDYRVSAVNSAGTGTASAVLTASTGAQTDTEKPTAPSGLAAGTPTSSTVPLSWTASTDNVGVVKYRVYRGGTAIAEPTSTSYTASGLSPATAYSFTVTALDAAGNESTASNTASATTAAGSATTFVQDSMSDGGAGGLLTAHTGETGATWSKNTSTADMTLANGKALTTVSTATLLQASGAPGSADYTAAMDIEFKSLIASVNMGICARLTSGGGGYAMRYIASGSLWRLDRLSGASGTSLASTASGVAAGQTKRIGIRLSGSTIVGTVDGVDVLTATDTTYAAAGNVGIIANGASSSTTGLHADNVLATS